MDAQTRSAGIISILIHLGIVFVAWVIAYMASFWQQPEPLVFELVAPVATAVTDQPDPVDPAPEPDPAPLPSLPEVEPLPPIPPLPRPQPVLQPQPTPAPEPQPRELINIRDFRRDNPPPAPVQTQRPAPRPAAPTPRIETHVRERLQRQLANIQVEGIEIGDIVDRNALQEYLAALRQRVQENFVPSGAGLEAEATFTVSATGQILNPRIRRSSGDAGFDQSALRALRATRSPGPPPGNRSYDFSLYFRSN